ncbi:MAG: TonB family protein [bacterium]|nr:TonB family protein [bacterium]
MQFKPIKLAVIFLLLIFTGVPAFAVSAAGTADEGDILVHLRLYEGSRGNEISKSSVVSSYYLKPLFVSSLVSEFNIREEEKELKRIFNLNSIKLMTRTQWGWKYGESQKRFRIVVLNGHEFLVQLTMAGKKNRFKMEVIDKGQKEQPTLLETKVVLPEKKSTVFGFEDSLGKPFFICLQREENKSVIHKEPVHGSHGRPKLVKRVKPKYPEAALKKKIHGQVLLDAVVDKRGNVGDVYLVDGVPGLNEAAVAAVKQWKFDPMVSGDKSGPVRFTVNVLFNLPKHLEKKPGETAPYTGELMDFHFEDADLVEVLLFIAKKTSLSIVVDPGIKGKVSCDLKQTPWDHALDLMLQLNGLDMIFKGNVLRIMKATDANRRLRKAVAGKTYSGKRVNLNFKGTPLKEVLAFLVTSGGMKPEIEPGITGKVSIQMYKVPWDQALDMILQVNALEMRLKGKVINIFKPKKVFMEEAEARVSVSIPNILPIRGYLKDVFGFRKVAGTHKKEFHSGIDIAAKEGAEVVAAADGFVVVRESRKGYGNIIIINHGYGYATRYAELSAFNVKKGDRVKRGQVIGYVGNSGSGGEPHLHYEVHHMGKPVNPMTIIRDK